MNDFNTFESLLKSGLSNTGLCLSEQALGFLNKHRIELMKWNKKINLTTITDIKSVVEKHYIDSLWAHDCFDEPLKIMDMGTGAGFPGIPIKIIHPGLSMTLVDSSLKKIHFLKHVIRQLSIGNIDAIHCRVEDLCMEDDHSNQYDILMSRAFSSLSRFILLGVPFLKSNGYLLAFKSQQGLKELNEIDPSSFHTTVKQFDLPFSKAKRFIIKITPLT